MKEPSETRVTVDRAKFFSVGRALQRGIGKSLLGKVSVEVSNGVLIISSDWGGSAMPCVGHGNAAVEVTAKAFCSIITTRHREKAPCGRMEIVFRPSLREIAIDEAG